MVDVRGFRVAVTAHRLVREQTLLFERLGATVVGLPLVELELVPEREVIDVIRETIADPPDLAVFSTGVGTRWLFAIADAADLGGELREVLDRCHVIARGPKARGALAALPVHVDWSAPTSLGTEVAAHVAGLVETPDGSTRCFVQLDGTSDALVGELAGVTSLVARTYRCSPATTGADLLVALGAIDAITFTSAVAVAGLREVAGALLPDVVAALDRIVTVAVGPVTAAALAGLGIETTVVPDQWRLGSMVRATAAAMSERIVALTDDVEWRGATLLVHGDVRPLPAGELRILRAIADGRGAVLGKVALARSATVGSHDPHAVEAIVTRLRRRLGPAAHVIETVPRRGYRLASSSSGRTATTPAAASAGSVRPSQP